MDTCNTFNLSVERDFIALKVEVDNLIIKNWLMFQTIWIF